MITWVENDDDFPPVTQAFPRGHEAAGLLAAGGTLSAQRLLRAYRQGIFPWYSENQPVLWWSTDPRMVLFVDEFKISHSLKKRLRKMQNSSDWSFRFDSAFSHVMRCCAQPRNYGGGTWINDEIISAYTELHQRGHAHSAELWYQGELVGGAYGVAIGRMFYGESMFAKVSDASKIALAHLVFFLGKQGVKMIDCQQETSHLASLGARPIARQDFIEAMSLALQQDEICDWQSLPEFTW